MHKRSTPRHRPWQKYLAYAALTTLLCIAMFIAYGVWHYAYVTVPNAYALRNAADLVIAYMERNDNTWPRGWDDLRSVNIEVGQVNPEGFADLQERVGIDWTADPRKLASTSEWSDPFNPSFRVIWSRNGSRTHWSGNEPNRMIWLYLNQPTTAPATAP